ncbi:ribonuclease P protein component [Chloroflexota bacterium]
MKSTEYLTKPEQYTKVYRKGSSRVNGLLVVKALPSELAFTRCGFSVSRRIGGAVIRNRVKRRLREILRQEPLKAGWDIVFIARPPAAGADYRQLKESVEGLLSKARLLMGRNEKVCLKNN